ncbi:hypothetical protein [Winogradskyella arenosi]|uniref:Uncharacterized protein n=1 Tax=Winogradskyella arenosi TaxID=533325 RepID=A0A368ZHL4_9FLAO|nr:hypothetical protein [Winogradskyella arenosi]RCW93259.1 hypothetical protein DFQ08_10150 [Winogradskyella arenosi]
MKNALFIFLFLTLSFAGYAQQESIALTETEVVDTKKAENTEAKTIDMSAAIKAKVIKMNRKKSKAIISIKAYRKSLQIKVKTVKLC